MLSGPRTIKGRASYEGFASELRNSETPVRRQKPGGVEIYIAHNPNLSALLERLHLRVALRKECKELLLLSTGAHSPQQQQ